MTWSWQLPNWPNYLYNIKALEKYEQQLLQGFGAFSAVFKCLDKEEQTQMQIQLLSEEAQNTSAIEGEYLNRGSLQSSIRREMGLAVEKQPIRPAEEGIAQMMLDAYHGFDQTLTHETLFKWHKMLTRGRRDLDFIGEYRAHPEPMLIVSGGKREPIIHFEAPPSHQLKTLMQSFVEWFNHSAPSGKHPLPAMVRAAMAHLYFETIHPFEDGNGRIGRAIAIKSLSQSLGRATLISLSYVIENNKKDYYDALKTTNHSIEIQTWLEYFANTIIKAQAHTQAHIEFLISKLKFFDRWDAQLNERQRKVLLRMFREGLDGFEGGLSAENYINITKASRATTTRDLQELVKLGALNKTGTLKHTRYYLQIPKNEKE